MKGSLGGEPILANTDFNRASASGFNLEIRLLPTVGRRRREKLWLPAVFDTRPFFFRDMTDALLSTIDKLSAPTAKARERCLRLLAL